MRSGLALTGPSRVRLSRALPRAGALLVLFGIVGLLALTPARATWGGANPNPYQWSNGSILCVFNNTVPAVNMSPNGAHQTGMGVGLDQIREVAPTTSTANATVDVSSAAWEPQDTSSAQWFSMNYTESLNVTAVASPGHPVGVATVSLNFSLPRSTANATRADQVILNLSVQKWPWQSSLDTLVLVVSIWSAFPTTEHMVAGSPGTARVESVRTSDRQPLEYFEAGASATTGAGAGLTVSPQTSVTARGATMMLTLGPGAGGASSIMYAATLGITPGPQVLGIPLYDYAAVAGGAGLVALAVGISTRRIRRHSSDLAYAEEPE